MEVYYLFKPTSPTFFSPLSGHLCCHSRNFIKYLCLSDSLVSVKTCLEYSLSTRNLKRITKIIETNRRHIFQKGRIYVMLTLRKKLRFFPALLGFLSLSVNCILSMQDGSIFKK